MFKKRIEAALINALAFLLTIAVVAILITLLWLTSFINKELPGIIGMVIIFSMFFLYIGTMGWSWIKWQFIEPYKEHKKNKKQGL